MARLNTNTILLLAIGAVAVFVIYNSVFPPVRFQGLPYLAESSVICAGDSISWVQSLTMDAWRQPADMTTARDLADVTRPLPGHYRVRPFIIPYTMSYTSTEVFSDTAGLAPADYIISSTTGGRLTARAGYAVKFTIRAC